MIKSTDFVLRGVFVFRCPQPFAQHPALALDPSPGSQFVSTNSGPHLVFTGTGPQFVFTGPGPQFVFIGPCPHLMFTRPGTKFVFSGPGPHLVFTLNCIYQHNIVRFTLLVHAFFIGTSFFTF